MHWPGCGWWGPIIDDGRIRLIYPGNLNPGTETDTIVTATSTDGITSTEEAVIHAGEWVLRLEYRRPHRSDRIVRHRALLGG